MVVKWVALVASGHVYVYPVHTSSFNPVRSRFRSRGAFTLQNLNRISELNRIKLLHLLEVVSHWFSFTPVQTASVNAKGISAKSH